MENDLCFDYAQVVLRTVIEHYEAPKDVHYWWKSPLQAVKLATLYYVPADLP
jgi:tRNA uridine 5-carbamoylmethylation protein Kti12